MKHAPIIFLFGIMFHTLLSGMIVPMSAGDGSMNDKRVVSIQNNMSGNPLFDGWYADPAVAIYDNRYWIFPTFSARYEDQVFFDAFSSFDLVHWEKHPRILDTTAVRWVKRALWAPASIE